MSGYIENEIVECNRLRSQEAVSGNNENPAQWTNTLSNIYELNAGDKVSMYSGFISEKGAGSLKTIELKGKTLGKKKKFTYVTEDTTYDTASKTPLWTIASQVEDEEIELKDNEANLILNYYKNTNGTGYIGLPRTGANFTTNIAEATGTLVSIPYSVKDGSTKGYISPIPTFDFMIKDDYQVCVYNDLDDRVVKVKNDNSKFTLFISQYSTLNFIEELGINSGFDPTNEPEQNWTIAPEYRHYYLYRQKLPINVDKGFNSAQFIADDLTSKLQGIISEREQIFSQNYNEKETDSQTIRRPVNKIIESETYKTFNCATIDYWDKDDVEHLGDGTTSTTWYNNYQMIGWKRPELYEAGQYININATTDGSQIIQHSDRLLGSSIRQQYNLTQDEPLRTNIPYTKENLLILKKFIDAQALYPEIWESWNDDDDTPFETAGQFTYGTGQYDHNHTVNNTRFFHMNVIPNIDMIEITPAPDEQSPANLLIEANYTALSTTLILFWDGTDVNLYNPAGDDYASVRAEYTPLSESVNVVSSVGDAVNNIQTLTLASGFTRDLAQGDSMSLYPVSSSTYEEYLRNRSSLGSSLYRPAHADPTRVNDDLRYSKLFLVYYNPSDKDIYYDEPDIDKNKLTYGCFTKESFDLPLADDPSITVTGDFINIHPSVRISSGQSVDLTPADWLDGLGNGFLEVNRKFGYDMHFTACCNPAIALFNGKKSTIHYYGATAGDNINTPKWGDDNNVTGSENYNNTTQDIGLGHFLSRRYVGADNPTITWDGEHFGIINLHTSENLASRSADGGRYIPNPALASGSAGREFRYIVSDVPDDEGDPIYIINPLQNKNEFCPAISPYLEQFFVYSRDQTEYLLNDFNLNYTPYTVYDSKSGIFLEDMGYDEDTWADGLWGIMGFSYNQFNGNKNTRLSRINNTNIKDLKYPTTNADIKITDTKNWDTNENSKPHYTDNLPTPFGLYKYNNSNGAYENTFIQVYPNINVKTTSIELRAENFPTSMIKGYYTIRSDIVPQSVFVGGKSNITNMPIVGIVDKMNPQSDYYFGSESTIEFTIGKPMKLSSITVSIHDPDGSYANVSNSSSVLFKIQRQMNVSFNVIGDILQNSKKNTKKSNL